jgi:hypothetical protein
MFPIKLEVEEIALGSVLRKLHDMPGIAKLDLDLGHGGQGAGKQKLQEAAKEQNGSVEQRAIAFLMSGPKHIREIAEHIGGRTRAYGVMNALRKKGITEPAGGPGRHQLKRNALEIKRGPGGRASPGAGIAAMHAILKSVSEPLRPAQMQEHMAAVGVSPKSLSGMINRAKVAGIIRKAGDGYELTAKGHKLNGADHG